MVTFIGWRKVRPRASVTSTGSSTASSTRLANADPVNVIVVKTTASISPAHAVPRPRYWLFRMVHSIGLISSRTFEIGVIEDDNGSGGTLDRGVQFGLLAV